MSRLQKERQAIVNDQMRLATEFQQASAEIEAGLSALGVLIRSLSPADGDAAVERLAAAWFTKGQEEDRDRFVTVIASTPTLPKAREQLRAVTVDEKQNSFLRALAVRGRGQPGDPEAIPDLVALLDAPLDQWPVIEAAIDGLRRIHRQGRSRP
jgi:hypothetical protein